MTSEETVEDNTPRVYVASLSDYNNGDLLGRWFAFCDYDDAAELLADVHAMLKTYDRLYPLPYGAVREEWAAHDYENFPERLYSESMRFEAVYVWLTLTADMDEKRKEALEIFLNNGHAAEYFNDLYLGTYGDRPYDDDYTAAEYAEQSYYEQYGENSIPKQLRGHIDWGSLARDLVLGGDIWCNSGHVFRS